VQAPQVALWFTRAWTIKGEEVQDYSVGRDPADSREKSEQAAKDRNQLTGSDHGIQRAKQKKSCRSSIGFIPQRVFPVRRLGRIPYEPQGSRGV